ncbi:hypothetical protein [Pseudomonas sp. Sample_16]|uniref:hypothetical protein n=1 Tax=Pseudomonas sp. Sample_16 TaxID=2448263 RepID=UPI0010328B4E|nr:hypothetical protein [Pseudomonas sp. Sample_16]
MATAQEYIAGFKRRHATPKKPPINWRKKYEAERNLVIAEAIIKLRDARQASGMGARLQLSDHHA